MKKGFDLLTYIIEAYLFGHWEVRLKSTKKLGKGIMDHMARVALGASYWL